jgi:hypothetical protein
MSFAKKCQLLLIIVLLFPVNKIHSQSAMNPELYKNLNETHDLNLPDWGPYSKRYIGVSHIPDKSSGLRFDLTVFPGFYRREVFVPNVLFENSYHPWDASPNLEYFCFRHELEWKDKVYTDISYSEMTPNSRLIRIECVNNTDNNQNLALHFMASINFPPPFSSDDRTVIILPEGAEWINAIDYKELNFFKQRPTDNLVPDGKMRGELRDTGFVNGSGIGMNFGLDKGDFISYEINAKKDFNDGILLIRYKLSESKKLSFDLSGMIDGIITFKGENEFGLDTLHVGKIKAGIHMLTLTSEGGNPIEFDGFVLADSDSIQGVEFKQKALNPVAKILNGPVKNSLILKYDDVDLYYGLLWKYDLFEIRQWYGSNISDYFKQMVNEHVSKVFHGEGDGHFTNVFLKPIELLPKSNKILYGVVCCGAKDEVEKYLSEIDKLQDQYEGYYLAAKKLVVQKPVNLDGEKYKFSIERMEATLACNVVYPVYMQKSYIRHRTPGRWWDCLYTWDSGFIGLGLLRMDTLSAIENLNAYVQEPGAQSAFIHHGSPVPVQQYLFLDLWNQTQSKTLLEYFYPRLKQYHEFLAGRLGSSTTRSMKSNLLKTWDYFYSSGGWDDYPAQKYTHEQNLDATTSPIITTSQAIRTAKILKMIANYLGKKDDIKGYNDDIETFSNAIQKYAWDDASGYFGYVVHDNNGNPMHILKYQDKVNYDMGFDGAYPLIAGICTDDQKQKILNSLKSDKHLWSNTGLSAVDQSAPYYKIDGYWNGTVWMSHQWFFWKTMLDLGEADFAFKIAKTGLDVWKHEVEATYNCMEHFIVESGRGAGWHEFGGLSSPVLMWYSAYFNPGNFTSGFDTWIENKKFNNNNSEFLADLSFMGNSNITSVVACMNPDYQYSVKWNGKELTYKSLAHGTLSVDIPVDKVKKGRLEIEKI